MERTINNYKLKITDDFTFHIEHEMIQYACVQRDSSFDALEYGYKLSLINSNISIVPLPECTCILIQGDSHYYIFKMKKLNERVFHTENYHGTFNGSLLTVNHLTDQYQLQLEDHLSQANVLYVHPLDNKLNVVLQVEGITYVKTLNRLAEEYEIKYQQQFGDSDMLAYKTTWKELFELCQDLTILKEELQLSGYIKNIYTRERIAPPSERIIILSSKIARLIHCQVLNLSNNGITHIPKEISKMVNLTSLILDENEDLSELPAEIGLLPKLTELCIRRTTITTIPPMIVGGKKLTIYS